MAEADKLIEERINLIIKEFDFENRKKNTEECPCYKENKKCHNIENLNCLLCYCPNYIKTEEGGCKINNPKGKWFFHSNLPKGKIWDCSDCDWPHKEENVKEVLKKIFKE